MSVEKSNDLLKHYSLDFLKHASTFGALSSESITWLVEHGRAIKLKKDEVLFEPTDPGDSLYVIIKGSISHYKEHDGHLAFIKDYLQGQQIGFMSMIGLHDRVGKAVANENTDLLEVNSSVFFGFHKEFPSEFGILLINLSRELARSLRSVDDKIVDQLHKTS